MQTLVLNRAFFPVHITSWRRALSLVYDDAARVVDEDFRTYSFADWRELSQSRAADPFGVVHTPSFAIRIPEVIALARYDRVPPTRVKFTRRNLYTHYRYRCCYCGGTYASNELNLEHVIPRSRGGRSVWENVVTACVPCNVRKSNRTPQEAGMNLLVAPTRPKARGAAALIFRPGVKMRASWQRFVDVTYWDAEIAE